MSKAVTFSKYGGPVVLHVTDVDEPKAGVGQVRVRVRTAGVNPIDWKFRRGLMAAFPPVTFPSIPGVEFAGVVDQVGQEMRAAAVGDEVLGSGIGTYAECVVTDQFVSKPIARTYRLEEAGAAQQESETGHVRGKIVLVVE
jgi:NADPH:quinone reductase-like Zn-dependent oxidoreductase